MSPASHLISGWIGSSLPHNPDGGVIDHGRMALLTVLSDLQWIKLSTRLYFFSLYCSVDSTLFTPVNVSLFIDIGLDYSHKLRHGYESFA